MYRWQWRRQSLVVETGEIFIPFLFSTSWFFPIFYSLSVHCVCKFRQQDTKKKSLKRKINLFFYMHSLSTSSRSHAFVDFSFSSMQASKKKWENELPTQWQDPRHRWNDKSRNVAVNIYCIAHTLDSDRDGTLCVILWAWKVVQYVKCWHWHGELVSMLQSRCCCSPHSHSFVSFALQLMMRFFLATASVLMLSPAICWLKHLFVS